MKRNTIAPTIVGLLLFFLLCFVPNGEAQSASIPCVPLSQGTTTPWQFGERCIFTASSGSSGNFSALGLNYYQVYFAPSGTLSGATLSIDSSATGLSGSWSTGGLVAAGSIGAMTSAGSFTNSSAVTPANYGQLTPTITGSGSVTVVVLGYVNAPSTSGSGPAANVSVTNTPTVTPTQSSGANLHTDVDNNQLAQSGSLTTSSSTSCTGAGVGSNGVTVSTFGASTVGIGVTGTWTGTVGIYYSLDGSNYQAVPPGVVMPPGGGASITVIGANGDWQAANLPAGTSDLMICGATTTGTATLSLQASLGVVPLPADTVLTAGAAWSSGTTINTLQYATGSASLGWAPGSAVVVQLDQTTTLSGGAVTFQGTFDGVNWVTIPVAQVINPNTGAQLTNPYSFVASTNQPFLLLLQGYVNVRANLTTVITGTGTVTPYWITYVNPGFLNANLVVGGQQISTVTGPGSGQAIQVFVTPPNAGGANGALTQFTSATFAVANVKSSTGNLIALAVGNNTSSQCWLEVFNTAGTPSLGSSVILNIPIGPDTGAPTVVNLAPYTESFSTGIGVGGATTAGGSSSCSLSGSLWYR